MDIANSKDWWKGRSHKPTTASGYELTRKHLGFKKKKKSQNAFVLNSWDFPEQFLLFKTKSKITYTKDRMTHFS